MSERAFSAFELKPNSTYRVLVPFTDFDGTIHPIGECWRYHRRDFLPYHAGLTLHIEGSTGLQTIRLQDYPEAQGEVVSRFSKYVVEE
jgi:hypothetical protein